ncbi:PadR family transcriptional regulator [Paenibacillus sp. GCM10027627]|uniref:PadR family transcriptional regulator n=1 Tax=unclassified Paenibacillus TaxID=185978 RepID=UPI003645A946
MAKSSSLDSEQLTDAAYYILLSLLEPRHGYGIMNYIEQLTEGEFAIGPATAYTLIKKLLDNGCIVLFDEPDNERRKMYSLTSRGKILLKQEVGRRSRMAQHGQIAFQNEEGATKDV